MGVRESGSLPTHTSRLWRRCRIERGEVSDWSGWAWAPMGLVGCLAGTGPKVGVA